MEVSVVMPLSENLKDQFAKMVNADNPKENIGNAVYGTVKVYSDGTKAVVLDGSNIATPFETVTDAEDGDRVTVTIRNHKAVVTGNLSSPAARTDAVKTNSEKIGEFNTVLSNKVDTDELDAQVGRINTLESDNATIKHKLAASEGEFKEIKTKQLEVEEKVTAAEAEIKTIKSDKIDATVVESEYTKTKVFDALAGTVGTLNGDFSNFKNTTTEKLDAHKADIDELNTKKLNSEDADLKYANIDFTNIGTAAMAYFYAQSGLIKNVVVGDQTITGELIGVTIKGDLIEGNTVVADKLVIKGEDGLYYKLNTDGITAEAEQTDYNSINGQVIRAKSVTASKIDVKDLVAFDATIAGFKIDDNAIHSIGKESATSGVRGIYLGKDGQMAVGDSNHYIKYYKDTDGSFKLAISAESMEFSSGTSVKDAIDDVNNKVNNIKSIKNTTVTYQVGDSNTKAPTGTWSPNIPSVTVGKYLWTRTVFTYSDNTISTSYGISSMGAKGDQGIPGTNGQNGKSIGSVINYYLATNANTGVTASTSGWTTTVQSVSTSKKYLWNYEIVKYTDGTIASTTAPCVIGSYGDTGEAGKNFNWNLIKYNYIEAMAAEIDKSEYVKSGKVICEGDNINSGFKIDSADCYEPSTKYILSGYITVISKTCNNLYFYNGKNHVFISLLIDGRNYSTPFGNELIAANSILNDGKSHYFELRFQTATDIPDDSSVLYTYIQLNKSNATNIRYQITGLKLEKGTEATDWCPAQEDLKGEKGDTGATGKGVKSTAITYQAAANGTTVPTGTWVASPPTTTSALPYMWTRTIITYTDNTISTSYSIGSTPEGIQVGGRNLLTGSAGWTKANPAKSTNAADGYAYIGGRVYLENGKTYTLQAVSDSVWATEHGDRTGKATIWIHGLLGDDFHRVFCGDGITSGRYTWTFVHTSATQNCEIRINGYSKITSFWDIKIESGNKATDWTPAPEDIDYAISDVNSKITKTKEEITQSVSKTYQTKNDMGNYYTTKQTDAAIKTRCDNVELKVDGIKIGGRNLAQKTSSKYYVSFSKFNGNDNVCFSIGNTLTDGLSVGDIISIKLVCKYTNIASVSGKTPQVRIIGAGNVTGWNDNGYFPVNNFTKLSGSNGEVTIIYQATINENHVKNSYWNTLLRTDAIQSGTIQCKMFKVERGTRYTDWTPAPEDVDSAINDVSESTNQYITDVSDSLGKTEEELADLKSNTNATLKLCVKEDETGRLKSMIEAIADTINITAKGGLNLTGNRFSVSSTNLTITKDGSMTCKKIVATGGTVGGWQIQSDGLYSMSGEQGSSLSLMNLGNFKGSSEDDLIISFRRWNTYPFYVTSGGELGCRKLAISVGYNKLNQRATTSANDTQAFNYAWTINGTGLFILNAGLWTDTTDDYGTTNCAIYVNGACVTSNTHRYGENSSSVELDAGATFVYWFRNANNQKVLLQAGSTKTGNKTLTYTVQGLFGLAVT
jgi:predicted  nucleic acid-binding Zn-ribbon protein